MDPDQERAAAELRLLNAEAGKLEAEAEKLKPEADNLRVEAGKLEAEARQIRHSSTTEYAKLGLAVLAAGIAVMKPVENLGWL